ncbi:cell division protein FtsL [Clostridium sp. A1-XYC3]|uniref:Cell division protein FtsL n=1 Tax=Clostridium tanneri TaxID=3037988 RepID=A0ABU4JND4_9CLOT|nr:cell division protein FtsL [Clostridium sp. A1-XYC3]MDW8799630.1 cell division protein FtsL [Clostridium sp. A1-XYC3]
MIVVNEDSIIQGNTVLKPKYSPTRGNEVDKEKANRKRRHKQVNRRVKNKMKIIRNIALIFIIGLTLVGRYCIIYDMQMELNSIKSNINTINKENENLRVELVKFNNIQQIEETAVSKLHMVKPDKSMAVYTNISKETIQSSEKKKQVEEEKSIWSRIKRVLF